MKLSNYFCMIFLSISTTVFGMQPKEVPSLKELTSKQVSRDYDFEQIKPVYPLRNANQQAARDYIKKHQELITFVMNHYNVPVQTLMDTNTSSFVWSVACDRQGHIMSVSLDHDIKIWDIATGQCLRTLTGHTGLVISVVCDEQGHVISGSYDCTIKIWDIETGTCIKELVEHTSPVSSVTCDGGGHIISGSEGGTIKIWDIETGTCIKELVGHTSSVNSITCNGEGHIISGSEEDTIKIWDIETGTCIKTLTGSGKVACDGQGHIIGSLDHMIKIWDMNGIVAAFNDLTFEQLRMINNRMWYHNLYRNIPKTIFNTLSDVIKQALQKYIR